MEWACHEDGWFTWMVWCGVLHRVWFGDIYGSSKSAANLVLGKKGMLKFPWFFRETKGKEDQTCRWLQGWIRFEMIFLNIYIERLCLSVCSRSLYCCSTIWFSQFVVNCQVFFSESLSTFKGKCIDFILFEISENRVVWWLAIFKYWKCTNWRGNAI